MTFFRSFTSPVWQIFAGSLLLLLCSFFYLVWWVISFRPNSSGGPIGGVFIMTALITGAAAVILTSGGIMSLSQGSKSLPMRLILLVGAVLFLVLLPVTSVLFHRIVTSELIIIHIWTTLELSAVTVLYGTGRFGPGRAAMLVTLVMTAFAVGLVCYVLHYRLDETARYINGMIPLTADAFVMLVFLGILAVS